MVKIPRKFAQEESMGQRTDEPSFGGFLWLKAELPAVIADLACAENF